jgi:predicted enzyme related to lactoylglutathione lyase
MRAPMVWFEIAGQHSDNLRDFYAELLGWRAEPPKAPDAPAPRNLARSPRRSVFARRRARAQAPPWWVTFYARVPDLDSAILRARSLGSRVLVPPTRHGDTSFAVISDPEGHPIGLCS